MPVRLFGFQATYAGGMWKVMIHTVADYFPLKHVWMAIVTLPCA